MTLQQLRYVIEIANCGSMNEAAKRLFISQPSISSAVRELEQELGITVFERTNKGISLSLQGEEFLVYARQVIEQATLLENRYSDAAKAKQFFAVSTQHYAFAVNAFANLAKTIELSEYELTIRDAKTYQVIEDVKSMRSEVGILYINDFNRKVITKFLKEDNLEFTPLFYAQPHVFISAKNPLAQQERLTLEQLDEYPYLFYDQGEYNSFYFSEELLSTVPHKRSIRVCDRATLFNLLIGLNGYTISSGFLSADFNGDNIISVPLESDETMTVGWICRKNVKLSTLATAYISALKDVVRVEYGGTPQCLL